MRRTALLLLTIGLGLGFLLSAATASGSDPGTTAIGDLVRWDLPQISEGVIIAGGSDVSAADNGDTITLTGSGHARPNDGKAFGGGTFVHKDANGNVLGQGVYYVTQFVSWGLVRSGSLVGTGLIDGIGPIKRATSGIMRLDVHLVGQGGSPQFDGVLTIQCHLPGTKPTFPEGIELLIPQLGLNFNKEVSGVTLFHLLGTLD